MNKRHYIYCVEDKYTHEFYWGSRSCICNPIDDPYMGSMKTWKPNKKNLIKNIIIEYPTRNEATKAEKKVVLFYINKHKFPLNRNYNIPGGIFATEGKKYKCSEEKRKKISESNKGKKKNWSEEGLKKLAEGRKKKLTEEHKKKINPTGRKHSDETKNKISLALKGRVFDDEWRKKLSESAKKRKLTEEHIQKLAEGRKKKYIKNKNNQ